MSTTRIARHAGTAAALSFVLIFFVLAIAFSGCAAQHQLTPQRPPKSDVVSLLSTPTTAGATASTAPYEAAPGYLAPPLGFAVHGKTKVQSERKAARILRRWHRQFQRAASRTQAGPAASTQQVPRNCKKCTVNLVAGNQTNSQTGKKGTSATGEQARATATTTGKNSGPVVAGSDSTSQTDQHGATNAASTKGNNNSTAQTNTAPEAPGVGATIAAKLTSPLGIVLGVAAAAGLVYGVVLWRKKKAVQNLV